MNEIQKAVKKEQQREQLGKLGLFWHKMVWLTFTFLLGIPNDDEENPEGDSKKKEEQSKVETGHAEIEVSKPNFQCHIEYALMPGQAAKFIDVACWNRAAKIYFENSTSAIIPLQVGNLKWIHFRVNHNIELSLEEVPLFRSHHVKFGIKLGSKHLGEPAKSDKPKKFYGPILSGTRTDGHIRKQMFQPLSESSEDLLTVSYFKDHLTPQQQLYISLDTTLETSENCNRLLKSMTLLSNEYHDENCERKPSPPFEEIPPLIDILQRHPDDAVASKRGKDNRVDKKTVAKNKEPDKMELSITGEEFFSGKKVFEKCLKYNSEELPYALCLATVKNPLGKTQAALYNPLSVVISSLDCVPVDELKRDGIAKLKFRFLMCNRFLAESNLIPIERRMKVDLARTIFTHATDKEELIYFIQTGGVNIQVLGNRDKTSRARDTRNANEAEEELVTLGQVSADVSSILFQPHRVVLKCNLQPSNGQEAPLATEKSRFTSTNEFNSCLKKQKKEGNRCLRYFTDASPVLTLAVGLGHPPTKIWQSVATNPDLFNRLFVVFYDADCAIPIVQMIQDDVDEVLGASDYTKNGINVRRPLTTGHAEASANPHRDRKDRMTGFVIDCADKILIYAESSVFGGVQKVWASTSSLNPLQGRVLYDGSLIFLDRLYESLFQFGGFIGITLKESPHAILSKPKSYSNQSTAKPAQKALKCLSLLTECKSIKAATQNNLFPDFDSLASLAIEFGAPILISDKK